MSVSCRRCVHGATQTKFADNVVRSKIEFFFHDFDEFLKDVDFVVIMVGHDEIKRNIDKLQGKIVLDTRKVCSLPETYYL